ncbi:MAG: AAA family ATPase [Prevotella sp.]|nr:AAA family ATPase [Prevotella sp.]
MEQEAEREEFRIQSERMPLERKIRRGVCWWPVRAGRSYYNSLNQLVVEIENLSPAASEDDETEADTLLEYGKPIQFFQPPAAKDGKTKYLSFNSTISYVEGNRMVVTVPSADCIAELSTAERLGLQLYFDETSYRTMTRALDDVINGKGKRMQELLKVFGGLQATRQLTIKPMSFPWLNPTQEKAVNEVLRAKDVAVVHGPPGTGKTTTLVEAIYETLHRETQVLVCAQSNMAVDWISEKLVDHGVPVLRIGNPTRVNDKMLSFTYERKFEAHPDYPELWAVRRDIRQVHQQKPSNKHQRLARLRDRAQELEMRINADLFNEARVVACTLVGAANKLMVGQKFSTLFIDEAAQALEPACWIAIRRAGRVILAGDHQQLPPTIKCYEAMREGLGRTLMERIVEAQPECVTLLGVQYRMNDAIMKFSSDWFYEGKLQSDPSVRHRSVLDYETPIVWIDNEEPEQYVGENHGRINKAEADLLLLHLQGYINKVGINRFLEERIDVGIISPYRVQTHYLRQQIRQREEFRRVRHLITVGTVDGFQGQERDIILISLVRSNEHGQIGFLSDLRRMNVAMTRARMKLLIFGNRATLSHSSFYQRLIKYIDSL